MTAGLMALGYLGILYIYTTLGNAIQDFVMCFGFFDVPIPQDYRYASVIS